jgi:hypothetical protein
MAQYRWFRSIAVFVPLVGISFGTAGSSAQQQDACRLQAKTIDGLAQDYRAAVRNVASVCTKAGGNCTATKAAAADALAALNAAEQSLATACVGSTPPPPPASAPTIPGDLLITEFMANPTFGSSGTEWFEILNPTATDFDLKGLVIKDDGTNQFTITTSLIIPAQGYVVIGSNGDPATNGSVPVDYVWSNFTLNNTSDQVEIFNGTTSIDRVTYTKTTISRATSLNPASFTLTGNDDELNWCPASVFMLNNLDYGTPKQLNPFCPI